MDSKIKRYVEFLFTNIPYSRKSNELKEEILSNACKEFEDYIQEGKTENEAYALVISSLGDVNEMLDNVMPNDEFIKQANYYRRRNAKNTAIGVAMYIIGAAFLIGLGGLGGFLGGEDFYPIVGLLILLVISAIATGLIIFTHMSTPPEYKNYNDGSKEEFSNLDREHRRLLNNILSIYWILITFIYLAVSFATMRWGITWIIWILGSVFQLILKTAFEMRYGNE